MKIINMILTILMSMLLLIVVLTIFPSGITKLVDGAYAIFGLERALPDDAHDRADALFDRLATFLEDMKPMPTTSRLCIIDRYLSLDEQYLEGVHYLLEERGVDGEYKVFLVLRQQNLNDPDQYVRLKEKELNIKYTLYPLEVDENTGTYKPYAGPLHYDPSKVKGEVFWYDEFTYHDGNQRFYAVPYSQPPYIDAEKNQKYYILSKYPTFYSLPGYDTIIFTDPIGPTYVPTKELVPISGLKECI